MQTDDTDFINTYIYIHLSVSQKTKVLSDANEPSYSLRRRQLAALAAENSMPWKYIFVNRYSFASATATTNV